MIEIELADGTILEAPDDADPSTVAKAYLAKQRAPARPYDPFTDAPRLPGEQGYVERGGSANQTGFDRAIKDTKRYAQNVGSAARSLDQAPGHVGIGSLDALGTVARGAIAAPIGAAVGVAKGQSPEEEARIADEFLSKYASPFTQQGRAQLGLVSALASPLTESGADIALAPILASESQVLRSASRLKPKPSKATPPTKEALREATNQAYTAAREAGVVYKPTALTQIRTRVDGLLKREGFDKDLHPDTAAVLRRLTEQEANGAPLTLDEMENLRRVALNAEGAQKPQDRRLASLVVDEFDEVTEGLGAAETIAGNTAQAQAILRRARDYHARTKKSDDIDALIRRAELSAPNFPASGMENALRTEFRALAKNEKRMRRFSPDERKAIERVAKGDLPTNALRMLGKFAPTGTVSTALSSGIGFVGGGPAGAVGLPLAGLGSRLGATALTKRNVQRAGDLVRGAPLEQAPSAAEFGASLRQSGMAGQPTAATATPMRGLLDAEEPPATGGLLGVATRSVEQIRQDLQKLDAKMQRLPETEPLDSPKMKAIATEWERLRAELSLAESQGAAP